MQGNIIIIQAIMHIYIIQASMSIAEVHEDKKKSPRPSIAVEKTPSNFVISTKIV